MTQLSAGIELLNGSILDFNAPEKMGAFSIEDFAHVASNLCRFAGHVPHFYSVAQHLANTSLIVDQRYRKCALMHDTSEAFTNDIVTPLKVAVPDFKHIEDRIEAEMAVRFGYEYPHPPEVKLADLQMLAIEKHFLRPNASYWQMLDGIEWEPLVPLVDMSPMGPSEAKAFFLQRWEAVQ